MGCNYRTYLLKTGFIFQDEEKDDNPVPLTPEDVALAASRELLVANQRGGCVNRKHQWMLRLYMVLVSEDVGRVSIGKLSPRRFVPTLHPSQTLTSG